MKTRNWTEEDEGVLISEDEWVEYTPTYNSINTSGRFYKLGELIPAKSGAAGPVKRYTKEEISVLEADMRKRGKL